VARTVVFTAEAEQNLEKILSYWNTRNKSTVFSKKLTRAVLNAGNQVAKNPKLGKSTSITDFRSFKVNNYRLVYEFNDYMLAIVTIQDLRQEFNKP